LFLFIVTANCLAIINIIYTVWAANDATIHQMSGGLRIVFFKSFHGCLQP
jgi:hypothetical protein